MRANPLLPGFHPDPSICQVGKYWYLVTSTFEYFPGLPIYRSADLSEWELVGHAVQRRDQFDFNGVKGSGGMFAPTLRYNNGRFYLVCTLMHGKGERGSFIITASDPAGEWSDPVWLRTAPGIDPSLFFDDDGTCWYLGCELSPVPGSPEQTDIWLQRFDERTLTLVGDRAVISNGALRGARWAEGPHLYKVEGSYLLLHAEGGTERNHAVMVARAEHVAGPYSGHPGNPVLTHRHLGHGEYMYGVGHADLTQDESERWWAVALGMRTFDGNHHLRGRETVIVPVAWENGWPVFAPGLGRVPAEVDLPDAHNLWDDPAILDVDHDADDTWLQLRTGEQFWQSTPAGVLLRATASGLRDRGTPAFLCHRVQHADIDVTARLTLEGNGMAGICLYQSENFHHLVVVRRDSDGALWLEIITVENAVSVVVASAVVDTARVDIWMSLRGGELRAGLRGHNTSVTAALDPRVVSTERAGGFVGAMVGPFVEGEGATALFHSVVLTPA